MQDILHLLTPYTLAFLYQGDGNADKYSVLYEDFGLKKDETADKKQHLDKLTKVLDLLRTGQW